jgi:hypothetical protein
VLPESTGGRQGFLVEDVQDGVGEVTAVERIDQRRGVEHRGAPEIDQAGTLRQQTEQPGIDPMAGVLREGQEADQQVGLPVHGG